MKIRSSYVSNSSSSSFIVKKDLSDMGISCIKLNAEQLKRMDGMKDWDDNVFIYDENKEYWLTELISDGYDDKYDIAKENMVFHYDEGGHGEPYAEEYYNEYDTGFKSVWLRKEHDNAKEMTLDKLVNTIKQDHGNCKVLVEYEGGKEIKLRIL